MVITSALPPRAGVDVTGLYKRLGLFISALPAASGPIRVIHIVPQAMIDASPNAGQLNDEQSAHWGHQVDVTLLPRRSRRETAYNHYVAGILATGLQPSIYPFSGTGLALALRRQIEAAAPDVVLVMAMPAMIALLNAGVTPPSVFFDVDDVPHRVLVRSSLQPPFRPGKLAYLTHVPALIATIRRAARLSQAIFTCSDVDRNHLRRWGMIGNIETVPNAVFLPEEPPPLPSGQTVLFLGAFHYGPNIEAAERMVRRVFPLIRALLPQARLLIAGEGGDRLPSAATAPDNVDYLGFVPDLDELYARSRVICVPIVNGGGTRVKLVEAAAYARPMVATRIGAEGLAFEDGKHILLRDNDRDIADACVRVLREDTLAADLGQAARVLMGRHYEIGALRDRLTGIFAGREPICSRREDDLYQPAE
jgi:glycosyltransferase involved in cell wall biosynthesis